ncbi:tyrosine-type recombinase/integrase [Nocardia sp. BMG111209]|uniref:tyrosine-type recombinase/integrase n=1 Tax=Nocardia sp. BMG111209 TaxID=1160137 RepID=UPI00037BB300|nr:tyrosine-type recombinase/integrase [Nocardia sp. BMG111209]
MSVSTAVRHADLQDLVGLLQRQQTAKVDVVLPATAVTAHDSLLTVSGALPILGEGGVTDVDGAYRLTGPAESQLAARLEIPGRYLRRLRSDDRLDLWDTNVNGLLHGRPGARIAVGEQQLLLLRLFTSPEPGWPGIVRAVLSQRYGIINHLDVLTAHPVKKTIKITGKVIRVKGQGMVRITVENTKNVHREIALPDVLAARLIRRQQTRPGNELGLIFPSEAGTIMDPTNFNDQWRRVRKALGFDFEFDITSHTWRKTLLTIGDDAGISAVALADHAGHTEASMTQNTYMGRKRVRYQVAAAIDAAYATTGPDSAASDVS